MKTIQIQKRRRKTMNKKEVEGIGKKNWLLHRLVALVYIPNPERLPYVCHKDNVPTNNRVENLYWGTQKIICLKLLGMGG